MDPLERNPHRDTAVAGAGVGPPGRMRQTTTAQRSSELREGPGGRSGAFVRSGPRRAAAMAANSLAVLASRSSLARPQREAGDAERPGALSPAGAGEAPVP